MEATPGVIYAFEYDVTEEMLRNAVMDRSLGKHLYKEEVHKGDLFMSVHGIGAGVLVAEIQESSNVTYRVYDYDRVDKNDNK